MIKNKIKSLAWLLFLSSVFMLAASFYFEFIEGMQPCPLCLMQRLCVILLLCITCSFLLTYPKRIGSKLALVNVFIALAGLYFSGRQLWLMSLPASQVPACMPGLDVLIAYFPWQTIAKALFWGAGDCAEESWRLLGIPMPGFAALYFVWMCIGSIYLFQHTKGIEHHESHLQYR